MKHTDIPLVSVIIPIYNLGACLKRCLNSILRQTYANLQIIVVDDGSTDDSLSLLKKYAQLDDRIELVCQDNQGVSTARNNGLLIARGEFVMFVDGDDWVDADAILKMYSVIISNNLDVVCSGFIFEDVENSRSRVATIKEKCLFVYGEDILRYYLRGIGLWASVWGRLYRKSFLDEYHFSFDPSLSIGEDGLFSLQVMSKANAIGIVKQPFFHILVRPNSATRAKLPFTRNCEDIYKDFLKRSSCWRRFKDDYAVWYVRSGASRLLRLALKLPYTFYKAEFKSYMSKSEFMSLNVLEVRFRMNFRNHIAALLCKNAFLSYYLLHLAQLVKGRILF